MKFAALLEQTSQEDIERMEMVQFEYSKNTIRKHKWVKDMYQLFCDKISRIPYPLDVNIACKFITFCNDKKKYSSGSVNNIIIPALRALHREFTGTPLTRKENQVLLDSSRAVNRVAAKTSTSEGKAPAILVDVMFIIQNIPQGLTTRDEEASLYLFGLYTGSRSVTVAEITIKDIRISNNQRITRSQTQGKFFLLLFNMILFNSNFIICVAPPEIIRYRDGK